MYNRYIPQSDGTWHRNRISDPAPVPESPKPQPPPREPEPIPCSVCQSRNPAPRPQPPRHRPGKENISPGSFWKQLLPKDFGTEDLLVVVLLLLMAGDTRESRNTALLTLALYLFL